LGKTQVKTCVDNCLYEITFHVIRNSYISCDALIDLDFLNNIVAKIENDVITIINVPEQNSDWSRVNRIDVIKKADKVDFTHIMNQGNKNMVKKLIMDYKIHKVK